LHISVKVLQIEAEANNVSSAISAIEVIVKAHRPTVWFSFSHTQWSFSRELHIELVTVRCVCNEYDGSARSRNAYGASKHRQEDRRFVITAWCTLVQSAVLRSHVVCLSVRPSVCLSVTLVNCDHIGWNSSKIISPLVSPGCSLFATPTWRVCSKGNTPKFGPKVTHPLLIWASDTFDRKLRPNGYR